MHAKCMCKCYIYKYIYTYICNFDRILFECFASILRCFQLKVILHGFVHFAWILHVFSLERCFQN